MCAGEGSSPLNHEQARVHELNIVNTILSNEKNPLSFIVVLKVNGFHVIFYLNGVLVAIKYNYISRNLLKT